MKWSMTKALHYFFLVGVKQELKLWIPCFRSLVRPDNGIKRGSTDLKSQLFARSVDFINQELIELFYFYQD